MTSPTRVLVLGGSGMLGSMVADVLSRDPALAVTATVRDASLRATFEARLPGVAWTVFDGAADDPPIEGFAWAINAIGITKPLIRDDNAFEIRRAIEINARLPHRLGDRAAVLGTRVLQIATDCVYSGRKGAYVEADVHDALDVYGKTKSLGETFQPQVHHLRCSIIGPEPKDFKFLVEWFRRQPRGASVNGFTNHLWNGVTTLHFAHVCRGIVAAGLELPHLQHVVPSSPMTKAAMLEAFAAAYGRDDVAIRHSEAGTVVDRTLATGDDDTNRRIWAAAGYDEPPTVARMIEEMGRFDYRAGPTA
jgi:dTDP-4-dehydrorhamnose reductase